MTQRLPAAILLASAWLLAGAAHAQTPAADAPAGPKNILKIAPLGLVHGSMPFTVESRLSYERVLGPRSSVAVGASYLGNNPAFSFIGSFALSAALSSAFTLAGHPNIVWTETTIRSRGYRYQAQYRRYLGARTTAPQGWYLSPQVSFSQADYTFKLKDFDVQVNLKSTNRNYNLLVGYQRLLGRHLAFDVFTGLGYRDKTTKSYGSNGAYLETYPSATKLKISSGLNLGWAF